MENNRIQTDRIMYYFRSEKAVLSVVIITGLFYNIGMAFIPWFEGQLVQRLNDIIGGESALSGMLSMALLYVLTVLFVQFGRFLKRLYVRKFANNIGKKMKLNIYRNILQSIRPEETNAKVGDLMTKAVSDAETCAEGMRKFTTEIFDTGVLMISYLVLLLVYDWRLTLMSVIFTPIAYFAASRMKTVVTKYTASYKDAMSQLNADTLERVTNAMTYRVYGLEKERDEQYEKLLTVYEKKAVYSNIWESSMQPLYQIIALIGVVFVLYFGARNVLGDGWSRWDIAAFSTYLSCFSRLALKSSKSAKLFNSVQKAIVSWKRIRPYLKATEPEKNTSIPDGEAVLTVDDLGVAYSDSKPIFEHVSLKAEAGQVIGITGEVACGKTTFGKMFLGERSYQGKITYNGRELSELLKDNAPVCAYIGHQLELFHGSIRDNICLGQDGDVLPVLKTVCMDEEVMAFEHGADTIIGDGGVRLSGGQQARIALARALYHQRPILVLDDVFSAVDQKTELQIFQNIRAQNPDKIMILMSHRLVLFPQMEHVLFMEAGQVTVSNHETLMKNKDAYRALYEMQAGGCQREKQ